MVLTKCGFSAFICVDTHANYKGYLYPNHIRDTVLHRICF